MKNFALAAFIAALTSMLAPTAQADGLEIIQNGKQYRCEPTDPSGSLACVEEAYRGPYSKDEAIRLCSGGKGTAPIACASQAYRGSYSKDESIQLCAGARSTGPVECADKAYRGPFSKEESMKLCRHNGTLARAECAERAYRGPYSKEEALKICAGDHGHLVMRSLKILEASADAQVKIQQIKLKQKEQPDAKFWDL